MLTPHIKAENLSIQFRSYNNAEPTLRESILGLFHHNKARSHTIDALNNINLDICDSDRIGVIGKNGAGKSTLLRCVAGIYPPSTGSLEITGNVTPLLELGTGLEPSRTVKENIFLNGAFLGMSKKNVALILKDILDFAELGEFENDRLENLSSGMKSRLSFSVASAVSPDILLLDEVFAAGDASFVKKARARMLEMIDETNILLMVSHQEKIIRDVCNKAIVFNKGTIAYTGSVADAYDYYKEEIIR